MCKNPLTIEEGLVVACRKCERCRYNRVKDWAGRNIAQAKVSRASFACTLTYGPELDASRMPIPGKSDHIRMTVLTYSDVQKFLKYLRSHLGYACDYLVTGEYGSEKARAHWHIILHFRDKVPEHVLNKNFSDRHVNEDGHLFNFDVCKAWPHGFMFWKKHTFETAFYNCKYILKDEADEASQRKPQMSKKPPLGAAYFRQLADLHVEQHLAPQSLMYRFPEVKKDDGSPLEFMLQGRSAEMYIEHFIKRWAEVHGDKRRPKSLLVDLFEEYGKLVFDEDAMLKRQALREQFPRGESKQRIPSAAEFKLSAREAIKARDLRNAERAAEDREIWETRWIYSANGEERQRREQLIEQEQFKREFLFQVEFEQYREYRENFDWKFISGKGWCSVGPRSSEGGALSFGAWRVQQRVHVVRQGRREFCERLGPVGKYNRHYGSGRSSQEPA